MDSTIECVINPYNVILMFYFENYQNINDCLKYDVHNNIIIASSTIYSTSKHL